MTEKLLPQSIEAEESVLGSLIIDPEAIAQVEDALRPDDFYRDAHKTLYQSILTLSTRREPADFVTLCNELERTGRLADVGGASVIASLMNAVPTSANAVYYARIVAQKALYRRLIHAAGQIAALAYEETDDALEEVEQLIFALGQAQGGASDLTPVQEVLSDCLATLDALHERRTSIIGVPTGYRHLDAPLGGLQRSDLVILAARPGTGKSSFALNVARHACRQGYRVALFSLEMSRHQLVMRLLSMEAGIDQHRLRLGRVEDHEWEQIVAAMGTLSEERLWIDDTAGISLSSLRSRARRLQSQHGVDLVIVDYLQLMRANLDGKRFQNREQEIAEISRGLKAIAKELDVPVLALAQLSRAVEVRASKVPQLSDLRESGCLTGDTPVYLPDEGVYLPIKECVGQSGFRVLALNTETWKLEARVVTRAFATGCKQTYKMTTRLGRTIRATGNHTFFTFEGWERLDQLCSGQRIALPRRLPGPACDDSLRLQAVGFWNDTGVSSHTTRSVHAHQRARLKATDVSHGTTLEHGSIFPSGPTPENPPKRYSVENVQKNYVTLLFGQAKSGNVDSTPLQIRNAAFIPMLERQGLSVAEIGKSMTDAEIGLLGHLIGDGCTLQRSGIQYVSGDLGLAEMVVDLAKTVFGETIHPSIKEVKRGTDKYMRYYVFLSSTKHLTHGKRNPVAAWLDGLDAFNRRSYEKKVPDQVFRQALSGITCFLRHLWATDGCIHLSQRKKHYAGLYYASCSRVLASHVQSLLLRLGINARISCHSQGNKGRDQYHVTISGKSDILIFLTLVGGLGAKKTLHHAAILEYLERRRENTNRDVIPNQIWRQMVVPAMRISAITTRQMQAALGNVYRGTGLYKQNVSRERATRLANIVQSEPLAALAQSDVYWDEIVSIVPDEETDVYDLTVEGLHNFVAGDMIVHNSIENEADVVLFIYRDDLYNPESETAGTADLIIAKHRNGPTGTIRLGFDPTQTRFYTLEAAKAG